MPFLPSAQYQVSSRVRLQLLRGLKFDIIVRYASDSKGKSAKKGKGSASSSSSADDKILKTMLACIDAPVKKEGPIPDDEKARRANIGRNYVIGCFQQHNAIEHDLTCKIRLKEHAIKMLPKNTKLREEALKISPEMPPNWRNIPVLTPPIEGFDPELYDQEEEK